MRIEDFKKIKALVESAEPPEQTTPSAPKKFIIRIPMYRGKGRNKTFVCYWYVTGFSWRNMSDADPSKIQYGPERAKAVEMGKATAETRLARFRVVGEVVPADQVNETKVPVTEGKNAAFPKIQQAIEALGFQFKKSNVNSVSKQDEYTRGTQYLSFSSFSGNTNWELWDGRKKLGAGSSESSMIQKLQAIPAPQPSKPMVNNAKTLKQVCSTLSYLITYKITPNDFKEMEFYFHSPVRLCVRITDNLSPEAWFKNGGDNLKMSGASDVKQLAEFLRAHGVRERKKPKAYKSTPSLYD